ncbi:MAG: polyprenol monophosphomannose synthase [bacterium]|nr:polyprenol monophosphomannose synthase [bacterium]
MDEQDFSKVAIKLIPTYNEKENIASLTQAVFNLYPHTSMMVLDDNSPDGTAQAVRNLQVLFPNLYLNQRTSDRGFGKSYLEGFKKVLADDRYKAIVMMDADFSHDPKVIGSMLEKLKDYEVVNGSRYISGGKIENWKWHRRLLSNFANFYVRTILRVPLQDMTTGFVCLRKDALQRVDLNTIYSDGYAFLVELKYKLLQTGSRFYEFPIVYTERREGGSKMSSRVIWESIWLPWKLCFKTSPLKKQVSSRST